MKRFSTVVTMVLVLVTLLSLCVFACAEETVNLIWWTYSDSGDAPTALKDVLERANAISSEKIGVTVDLLMKTGSQVSLDLNTGEYYDMIFTCDWYNDFDSNAQLGYYYDLTDLIQAEAPALYAAVNPWWDIGTLNGRVYGVPMLKDLGAEVFFRINSDYYEGEKGITLPEEMAFAELEPLLKMYKEDHPTEYPLYLTSSGPLGMFQTHERIVGNYLVIPYDRAGTPDGTKIIPVWEDEAYMEKLRCLHRWYELGYINPDAATTDDMPYSLGNPIRTGTAWTGYKGWSNPEIVGFNVKLVRFIGPNMSRSTQQGSLIAVNAAAPEENVKACLKYTTSTTMRAPSSARSWAARNIPWILSRPGPPSALQWSRPMKRCSRIRTSGQRFMRDTSTPGSAIRRASASIRKPWRRNALSWARSGAIALRNW